MGYSEKLNIKVRKLGYSDYQDYLNSDHWKQFKESYKRSTLPQVCLCCGHSVYQLHHINYKNLNREKLTDVIPLCYRCHNKVHEVHKSNNIALINYKKAIESVKSGNFLPSPKKKVSKNKLKKQRKKWRRAERQRRRIVKLVAETAGSLLVDCPVCGKRLWQEGEFCQGCGNKVTIIRRKEKVKSMNGSFVSLSVDCPVCGRQVWQDRETCHNCGGNITVIERK